MNPPAFNHRPKAFSLIEVLVAITILSIIVALMVSLSNQASRAWLTGVGQNERRSNGRLILDFMVRDLKAAVRPTQAFIPNATTTAPADLQFIANISTATDPATNPTFIPAAVMNPLAAFWQAPVSGSSKYGNIAEVGYFVKWDTTTRPGTALAQMCRYLVNPDAIDPATGNTPTGSQFLIYNRDPATRNPLNWLSNINAVAPATSPGYQGWFADNVVALWVRCLDSAGQPITVNAAGNNFPNYGYDSRQGYTDSLGTIHPAPALPAAVDLAIVTVDTNTANRITAPLVATLTTPPDMLKDKSTNGSIARFMDNLPAPVKAGAQLFTTTVYIPTR